jgi:hypothetical protein
MFEAMSPEEQEVFLDTTIAEGRKYHAEFVAELEDDSPFTVYADFYLNGERMGKDDDIPKLFATIPMNSVIPKLKTGATIPVLTTVQITFMSGLFDVGINTNLGITDNIQVRVNYRTLTNYRSEP